MNNSNARSALRRWPAALLLWAGMLPVVAHGQATSVASSLIAPGVLPPTLAALGQTMGGRMTSAGNAQMSLTGVITDANGSRSATIMVQPPLLLVYREAQGRAITFNGTAFQTSSGEPATSDQAIMESLLAHLPDAVLLQAYTGGGIRTVGSHFRTDNGKTPNYTGPYWTVVEFAPKKQPQMAWGQPLQQELFLAIDEKTRLLAETRRAVKGPTGSVQVTQTQFLNWTKQGTQWFPGNIVRLEGGKQTLSFEVKSASTGTAAAATAFQP